MRRALKASGEKTIMTTIDCHRVRYNNNIKTATRLNIELLDFKRNKTETNYIQSAL